MCSEKCFADNLTVDWPAEHSTVAVVIFEKPNGFSSLSSKSVKIQGPEFTPSFIWCMQIRLLPDRLCASVCDCMPVSLSYAHLTFLLRRLWKSEVRLGFVQHVTRSSWSRAAKISKVVVGRDCMTPILPLTLTYLHVRMFLKGWLQKSYENGWGGVPGPFGVLPVRLAASSYGGGECR